MKKRKVKRIQKPIIDWYKFDSWLEWEMYKQLTTWDIWEYTGIEQLKWAVLVKYPTDSFVVLKWFKAGLSTFKNMVYTADFIIRKTDGTEVLLEVKSKWSWSKPDYRLRMKLFLSKYKDNINFAELINIKKWVYEYEEYF